MRPSPALEHLWNWYQEIIPVPQGTDFNLAVWSWASLVGEKVTSRELQVLKRIYYTHLERLDSDTPPMQEATDDNIMTLFSALAKQPGQK